MKKIHHINCGTLEVEGYSTVVCHCLLLEDEYGLTLVDSGIGMADVEDPVGRLGQDLIDIAGFQFNESNTAVRRIESLGFSPKDVNDIVLTHCDPDHTGGLGDFPNAHVHVAEEELHHSQSGHWRYVATHFDHNPHWKTYGGKSKDWFGIESRPLDLKSSSEIRLIPLFGHTLGHCGVAVQQEGQWYLHVGDAYYLRVELTEDDHPVCSFAAERAVNDEMRRSSLAELRRLNDSHSNDVKMIGYHDITELPDNAPII